MSCPLVRASEVLFLAILVWAPVPYASNLPWAWSLLAALLGLALLLGSLGLWRAGTVVRVPDTVWVAALLYAAGVGWGVVQGLAGSTPEAWAHPFWGEVRAMLPQALPAVGLAPENAFDNAMRLLAWAAAFALALVHGRSDAGARRVFLTVLAVTTLEAAYGLLNHFAGWNTVLWEEGQKAYAGSVTGTFVNRNSFATYANLGILVALALLLRSLLRASSAEELRRLVVRLMEGLIGRRALLLVALLLLVTASLLTGSRGGFLSLLAALLVFALLGFLVTRPRPAWGLAAVVVALLAAWGLFAISGETVWERLLRTDASGGGRLEVFGLAVEMMRERPWLGHGLGGFEQAFQLHRDERFPVLFDMAHNTYLEHAVELGIPAAAALHAAGLILFAQVLVGTFRRRRGQIYPLVAACACVLVGLHALVDFSLQIPAVAVTFAALLGVGVTQSLRTAERHLPAATAHIRTRGPTARAAEPAGTRGALRASPAACGDARAGFSSARSAARNELELF